MTDSTKARPQGETGTRRRHEAINWVLYIMESATTVNKEYIYKLTTLIRQEQEKAAKA